MKRLLKVIIVLCILCAPAFAQYQKAQGWCGVGGVKVAVAGTGGSALSFQQSAPACTVTVYYTGLSGAVSITSIVRASNVVTATFAQSVAAASAGAALVIAGVTDTSFNGNFVATSVSGTTVTYAQTAADASSVGGTGTFTPPLYTTATGTAKANPFTAASNGLWFFYASQASQYDVVLSGGGLTAPVTLSAMSVNILPAPLPNALDYPGSDMCAQINSAIQASPLHSAAVGYPPIFGGYTCAGGIVIDRPTWLFCAGGPGTNTAAQSSCALKIASGVTPLLWVKPYPVVGSTAYGTKVENINIQSLGGASVDGMWIQSKSIIDNVTIYNVGRDGLIGSSNDLGAGAGNADGTELRSVRVDTTGRYCFRTEGTDSNTWVITAPECTNPGTIGYYITTPDNIFIKPVVHCGGCTGNIDYHIESLSNRVLDIYAEGGTGRLVTINGNDTRVDITTFGQMSVDPASTNAEFSRITAPFNVDNGNRHWCSTFADCSVIDLQLVTDNSVWFLRDPNHADAQYLTFTPGATTNVAIGGTVTLVGAVTAQDNLTLNGSGKTVTAPNVTATNTVRANTAFSANGTAGASQTIVVKGSAGANCNLVFTMGLLTSTTCP